MRRCIRCGSEMKEGYGLKVESALAGIASVKLSDGVGAWSNGLEKVKVAVCPKCGEVSIYIEELSLLK